jgi:hypothetical protein
MMMRQLPWFLLQGAILMLFLWFDPSNPQGAVVFGGIAALIATGLLTRLLSGRTADRQQPLRDSQGLLRSGRHSRDSAKLPDRLRVGKDVR